MARECPTTDGPSSARSAPPTSSRAGGPVGGRVATRRDGDAEADGHQGRGHHLVDHRAGVEGRQEAAELEALAVDRRDRHLQDRAGGARPGGVRQQAASLARTLCAGPRPGEHQGQEEGQSGSDEEADEGDRRDHVAQHGDRRRGRLRLGRRGHARTGCPDREGQGACDRVAVAGQHFHDTTYVPSGRSAAPARPTRTSSPVARPTTRPALPARRRPRSPARSAAPAR